MSKDKEVAGSEMSIIMEQLSLMQRTLQSIDSRLQGVERGIGKLEASYDLQPCVKESGVTSSHYTTTQPSTTNEEQGKLPITKLQENAATTKVEKEPAMDEFQEALMEKEEEQEEELDGKLQEEEYFSEEEDDGELISWDDYWKIISCERPEEEPEEKSEEVLIEEEQEELPKQEEILFKFEDLDGEPKGPFPDHGVERPFILFPEGMDSRTNPFQEGEVDVSTGAPISSKATKNLHSLWDRSKDVFGEHCHPLGYLN